MGVLEKRSPSRPLKRIEQKKKGRRVVRDLGGVGETFVRDGQLMCKASLMKVYNESDFS